VPACVLDSMTDSSNSARASKKSSQTLTLLRMANSVTGAFSTSVSTDCLQTAAGLLIMSSDMPPSTVWISLPPRLWRSVSR
jgi:hypothetical protein